MMLGAGVSISWKSYG